jgi:hypothetical protein
MLAPGDYLSQPVPPPAAPAHDRRIEATLPTPVSTTPVPPETESPSFLLILLRTLGAIHT